VAQRAAIVLRAAYLEHSGLMLGTFYFEFCDEWWKARSNTARDDDEDAFGLFGRRRAAGRPIEDALWIDGAGPKLPLDELVPYSLLLQAIKDTIGSLTPPSPPLPSPRPPPLTPPLTPPPLPPFPKPPPPPPPPSPSPPPPSAPPPAPPAPPPALFSLIDLSLSSLIELGIGVGACIVLLVLAARACCSGGEEARAGRKPPRRMRLAGDEGKGSDVASSTTYSAVSKGPEP